MKIKYPRARERESKRDLLEILARNNVYAPRIITLDDGYAVLTYNDEDVDRIFQEVCREELRKKDFTAQMPYEVRARKTILMFRLDDYVYQNNENDIAKELMDKNSWAKDEVETLFKFPRSNTIKVTFQQTKTAIKTLDTGLVMFNHRITPHQMEQERYVPINNCMKCYAMEEHITSKCPMKKDFKICSECAESGHIWKDCTSQEKKCINCEGDHRTMAMKCPKRKELITRKINSEKTTPGQGKTYAQATGERPTSEFPLDKGTTAKIVMCMIHAHLMNMGDPGSFNRELNNILSKNNLPNINAPSNPPSKKIFQVLTNEDEGENYITTWQEENVKLNETNAHQRQTPKENRHNNQEDMEEEIPPLEKTKGTDIGLIITASEKTGFPKGKFNTDKLTEGINKNIYKWTYSNKDLSEELVYNQLCNNEIDLKSCWRLTDNGTFRKIRSGLLTERSPLHNRDPRHRRTSE